MFGRDKIKLFTNPTPLQKLENISKELGVELYIKRDDMAFDIGMGGNKLRKLEYLLAQLKSWEQQSCSHTAALRQLTADSQRRPPQSADSNALSWLSMSTLKI